MFQGIYESAWHHPVSFWLVGGAFLGWLGLRMARGGERTVERRTLAIGLLLFQAQILVDAWFTSAWTPLAPGPAQTWAIVFVILGDLRFFLLVERFGSDRSPGAALAVGVALSFVVPVASLLARVWWPDNTRALFLTYELMFFVLALGLRLLVLPVRLARLPQERGRWLSRVTSLELVQYGTWASADIVILSGLDLGYGLRLIPNTLYYAAFLPMVHATAPKELRA